MVINRRSDYACRMIREAYQCGESYVSVSEVAEREDIPYAFARSIQHDLVHAGILKTIRGAHGGLALACDPKTTTVLDVLEALQGPLCSSNCCMNPEECQRSQECEFSKIWRKGDALLRQFYGGVTLFDLFEGTTED